MAHLMANREANTANMAKAICSLCSPVHCEHLFVLFALFALSRNLPANDKLSLADIRRNSSAVVAREQECTHD